VNAQNKEKTEKCEPGASNALFNCVKKYEMPGEKSKPASAAAVKETPHLAAIGKGCVLRTTPARLTAGKPFRRQWRPRVLAVPAVARGKPAQL
jgi:hypothetical protein